MTIKLEDLYQRIDSMSPEQVDELNFGAIQLNALGTILAYNRYESELAKLDPKRVIGKNFFTEVAPCTDVREFAGRFYDGIKKKNLHAKFRYRFMFKNQPPRTVLITMHYSKQTETAWVFVQAMDQDELPTTS